MPYTAYGTLTPFSEYNDKTIRKSPKTQNYSTQNMEDFPVIIAEVSVVPSGNTFFFLRMFQSFYRRFLQNTTNNVTGAQEDHDRSYSVNIVKCYVSARAELLHKRRCPIDA